MLLSQLTDSSAVASAIAEYDELGRDAFLRKYGYGRSRSYYLIQNGKRYDSKLSSAQLLAAGILSVDR